MIDSYLEMADAAICTAVNNSTVVIGDNLNLAGAHATTGSKTVNPGLSGLRLKIKVTTAFEGSAPTFHLAHSADDSTYAIYASSKAQSATVAAGVEVLDIGLPTGIDQYIQVQCQASGNITGGAINAYVYATN